MASLDCDLGEAPSRPVVTGFRGTLFKKAGGKAFVKKKRAVSKWNKRWFVLPPGSTRISYYKSETDQMEGQEALGAVDCEGATVFLKEIKSGVHRFTIRSAQRELKLRAPGADEYASWMEALKPITDFRQDEEEDDEDESRDAFSLRSIQLDGDGDDDDEDSGGSPSGVVGPPPPGYRGYLEKKSGGKDGRAKSKLFEKWDKRWCVLPPSSSKMSYYKSEGDHNNGKDPAGQLDCQGARCFLKEIDKKGVHRFTVKNAEREQAAELLGYLFGRADTDGAGIVLYEDLLELLLGQRQFCRLFGLGWPNPDPTLLVGLYEGLLILPPPVLVCMKNNGVKQMAVTNDRRPSYTHAGRAPSRRRGGAPRGH